MKKAIIGIGIGIAVAVIAIGVVVTVKKPGVISQLTKSQKDTPASVIPQDAVAYFGIYDVKENWNKFKKSNFWTNLAALPLWQDIQFEETMKTLQDEFKTQTGLELNEDNFMELFGQEFAFALFMGNERQSGPSAVILSKVGTKTRLATALISLSDQGDAQYEKIDYKGTTLYHMAGTEENPMDMTFTFVQNMMLMELGTENKNITAIVDLILSGDGKGSLKNHPRFKRVTAQEGESHMQVLYVNAKSILTSIDSPAMPELFQDEDVRNGIKTALSSLETIGGSAVVKPDGLFTKFVMVPNYDTDNEQLKKVWSSAPQPSKALGMVPRDTIFFSSSQSMDLAGMWNNWQENMIRQNAEQANAILTTVNTLETNLGMTLREDVFPVLSNELAYFIYDLDVQGFIPIPKLAVCFRITDAKKANDLMQRLVSSINNWVGGGAPVAGGETAPLLAIENASFMDVPVSVIKINQFPVPGLTPSYAILGDELIITSNSNTLNEIIAVANGKQDDLRDSENYGKVKDIFTEKNNQLSFVNVELAVTKVVDLCKWLIDLQEAAGETGGLDPETVALLKENLIPLVECFKSIKALAANTLFTSTGIEKVVVYRVEDF
ncbi:MAG: DUF3352 domain-containing protein [Candidatus Auribacter fodinae]|jgi:hypothetical protein|uniref:DUF3352 domain-containing protein n=1 Tax=Candidatus Auribacter fodinae TaxID=2093366 RepID=A0A3A4QSM8_9BACT|nr:MAG: DUF3352 domain-containing protein [Candidatus Auribacter fodinae]